MFVALRDSLVLHMVCFCMFLQTLSAALGDDFTQQRTAELLHTYRCLFDSVPERFDSLNATSGRRRPKKAASGVRLQACSAPPHGRLPVPGPMWISVGVHGSVGSDAVTEVAA